MRSTPIFAAVCLGFLLTSGRAQAQTQLPGALEQSLREGYALQHFEPAPAGDRFFAIPSAHADGRGPLALQLLGNYAYKPLRLRRSTGEELSVIAANVLYAHLGASVALARRVVLNLDVPVALVQTGEQQEGIPTSVSSGKLADLRVGARVALLGDHRSKGALALGVDAWLPTGDPRQFTGDRKVRVNPKLIASGTSGPFVYGGYVGYLVREGVDLGAPRIGSSINFGASVGLLVADGKAQIGPELYGSTVVQEVNGKGPSLEGVTTPLELLLGAKLRASDLVLGLGAGPGLTRAPGIPAFRAVFSVAYAPQEAEGDRDKDGIVDSKDACVDVPGVPDEDPKKHGCPEQDRDKDGIVDRQDACVDVPGVKSEDPKKHGCPEPKDTDGDGILDEDDACVKVPGVKSDDPKKHGCPELKDTDGDGIFDDKDQCINDPEDKDNFEDDDGCPDPDNDRDSIPDEKDACPNESGKPDRDPKKNGCPKAVRVIGDEIIILQQVQFDTAKATIRPISNALLDEVAGVLKEHVELVSLEVQGHTDNRGDATMNQQLSQDRAAAVVAALVKRGVDASRLTPVGYGADKPVADNKTDAGRQKNRRVQFVILKREKR
ncbi:MAG: OmpA family protein [Polyangiaceae bacterium]|nr:OmpA family protein [Polyangiaceae bacterium]